MTHLSITTYYLQVDIKKILFIKKILPPVNKVTQWKIIWFNPPYSLNVEINIGKTILKLIDKHFPKTNRFHKIFNRKNVKVSCSCLRNFANMIKAHNNTISHEEKTQDQPKCNCRQLLYQCNIKDNNNQWRS